MENFFFCAIKCLEFRDIQQAIHNHLNQPVFIKLTEKKKQNQISLYYPEIFVIVLQIIVCIFYSLFIFFFFICCRWHIALQTLWYIKLRTNSYSYKDRVLFVQF